MMRSIILITGAAIAALLGFLLGLPKEDETDVDGAGEWSIGAPPTSFTRARERFLSELINSEALKPTQNPVTLASDEGSSGSAATSGSDKQLMPIPVSFAVIDGQRTVQAAGPDGALKTYRIGDQLGLDSTIYDIDVKLGTLYVENAGEVFAVTF